MEYNTWATELKKQTLFGFCNLAGLRDMLKSIELSVTEEVSKPSLGRSSRMIFELEGTASSEFLSTQFLSSLGKYFCSNSL